MINFQITDCSIDSFGVKYLFWWGFWHIYTLCLYEDGSGPGARKGRENFPRAPHLVALSAMEESGPAGVRYLSQIAYQCESSRNTCSR